jgi:hypothetical protein
MAQGKRHTPEQAVTLLRQIDVWMANGNTTPSARKEVGVTEQTYHRWRKEYGDLKVDQAKRLKELEQENGKLMRLVAISLTSLQSIRVLSSNSKLASERQIPCRQSLISRLFLIRQNTVAFSKS